MAYYQNFESDEDDPDPLDTMEEISDDALQRLGLYRRLGYRFLSKVTGLTELALRQYFTTTLVSPENSIYYDIETYFNNGQCHDFKLRMSKLYKISRFDDINCFRHETQTAARKLLLWHGTKDENIASILTLGFTLPTPQGQMFGNGIYFADRASKSTQYSTLGAPGTKGHLFLCSVALGKCYPSSTALGNYASPPPGHDSILGAGKLIPDDSEKKMYYDAEMPCGKTISRPLWSLGKTPTLKFNEYIVYDIDRITTKFLVEFEVV